MIIIIMLMMNIIIIIIIIIIIHLFTSLLNSLMANYRFGASNEK